MKLNQLAPAKGARKTKSRVGRGIGSGWGKTSAKGEKGQKARSGAKGNGFEGGQMPLTQRMPKRGFHNPFKVAYAVINLKDLKRFPEGAQIDPQALAQAGLASRRDRIKILGTGDAPKGVKVKAHKFSKSATEKLAAGGGSTEVL